MNPSLIVECIYHDVDVVEIRVKADNGQFHGEAEMYVATGELAEVAKLLSGFPRSPLDKREITLGTFGAGYAGGAAALHFYCSDRAGHARLELQVERDYANRPVTESVTMFAPVEAASVDRFVSELKTLNETLKGRAVLSF